MTEPNTIDANATAKPLTDRVRDELLQLEKTARDAAKKRIQGTRVEKVLNELPGKVETEVDRLLDRVGLVRKAKLGQESEKPAKAEKGEKAGKDKAAA